MSKKPNNKLTEFILEEWANASAPEAAVSAAAEMIAARFGEAHIATFFYGSSLRTGAVEDAVLDFYVIVNNYAMAYERPWLRGLNWLIPPNVFYQETEYQGITVRSKYAVLSVSDFAFRCSKNSLNTSVWARFSQPVQLLSWANDWRYFLAKCSAAAALTMVEESLSVLPNGAESNDIWLNGLDLTYTAELRSERKGKALELYLQNQERYEAITALALNELNVDPNDSITRQPSRRARSGPRIKWMLRRMNGRTVSLLRLMKASITFEGGIDYLAWKIKRHSGVEVEITPWMRKHQFFGGLKAYWSIRGKGAVR